MLHGPSAGWWTLPLPVAGRTDPEGQGGRQDRVSVVVATAVNGEGTGMDVGTSEDGAFWLAFLRCPPGASVGWSWWSRTLIRDSSAAVFGGASWQRCDQPAHRVPRRAQPWVTTMVRYHLPATLPRWRPVPPGGLSTRGSRVLAWKKIGLERFNKEISTLSWASSLTDQPCAVGAVLEQPTSHPPF